MTAMTPTTAMTESRMAWEQGETWYRVVGDLDPGADQVPLVLLHGGPGAPHDYLEPAADLVHATGRTVVLYDQIGCGGSTHLPDAPSEMWTVELFKEELSLLLDHLGVSGRYALLGQSWGGMLAMEHALDQPPGLVGMVVADSPASIPLWLAEANRLRGLLPPEVEATLRGHEDAGTTDTAEYAEAVQVFYDRHLCRVPMPEAVVRSFAKLDEDPTVYHTMNGPSEFHCIGTLKDWDITDQLHRVAVPTLLLSGRHDEATPAVVTPVHGAIAGSEWVVLEESSHLPHVEEPERFGQVVNDFLSRLDH
jgi:L-proline amide hydrolase